ncbi:MAG TPA: ATP-dependent Clp protease proteolytic subunit [Dehalococcoidia bacterium]
MPSWNEVLAEIKAAGSTHDLIRRKYLLELSEVTGRNVIVYYSGWLQKPHLAQQRLPGFELNDDDKNGFMAAVKNLDRDKGVDLILHTPGGEFAATESIVDYLRAMFGSDIRAVVPQLAMSAGTMIACAAKSILMGKHSSLGPVDPQVGGLPAHGIIEEFKRAANEIQTNQLRIPLWQPIIAKYTPTLVGECEKAIDWANEMVKEWLATGMFAGQADAKAKAEKVVAELGDHALTKSHARHISADRAKEVGLVVEDLESEEKLQDAVLTVHHACIQTLTATDAQKIIENQIGTAYIKQLKLVVQAQG